MSAETCKVLLVYPRFNAKSFWSLQATCEVAGAQWPAAPLGLITVAALLPAGWDVRLVNRNTEELTEAEIDWADLVMTGGMLPQQPDTLAVVDMAQAVGKPVVVGGPDATSTPEIYDRADFLVLGEAEEIMSHFIAAWRSGAESGRFEAEMGKTDVTKSPIPRFDLLKFKQYLQVGVQFSRGCPFNCEFCDIIELYGRIPRTKTTEQVLAELDHLHALGYRGHVDFVDDNLIGNKKSLRKFLPQLESWIKAKNYPFEFTTEASVNLADDNELMKAMSRANFFMIFIGIESPDANTLVAMQKKQNTRRSLQESIYKIYRAGLFVNAGFIVGFDSETGSVAEGMIACIENTAIPICTVGLLYALPNTQLTRRLAKEKRLFDQYDPNIIEGMGGIEGMGDQCTAGLNFETKRPRMSILDDYRTVLRKVYSPAAFFGRVRRVGRMVNCQDRRLEIHGAAKSKEWLAAARLAWRLSTSGRETRREFWRTLFDCLRSNRDALPYVMLLMALYVHVGPFTGYAAERIDGQIDDIQQGRWRAPNRTSATTVPQIPADKKTLALSLHAQT
jgi:radical SAM superfamily enzyme YgiQ (UPF0313 family)